MFSCNCIYLPDSGALCPTPPCYLLYNIAPYCLSKFKKSLNSKAPSGILELPCLKHEGLCKFPSRHQTSCCHSWKRQNNCNKNNTSFIVLFLETPCWNCPSITIFPSFLGNKRRSWWTQAARSLGWYTFSGEEGLALHMIRPRQQPRINPQSTGGTPEARWEIGWTRGHLFCQIFMLLSDLKSHYHSCFKEGIKHELAQF